MVRPGLVPLAHPYRVPAATLGLDEKKLAEPRTRIVQNGSDAPTVDPGRVGTREVADGGQQVDLAHQVPVLGVRRDPGSAYHEGGAGRLFVGPELPAELVLAVLEAVVVTKKIPCARSGWGRKGIHASTARPSRSAEHARSSALSRLADKRRAWARSLAERSLPRSPYGSGSFRPVRLAYRSRESTAMRGVRPDSVEPRCGQGCDEPLRVRRRHHGIVARLGTSRGMSMRPRPLS